MPYINILGQTVRAYIMEICQKNGTLASCLSRSLGVIGTNTDRSTTYDFVLVIHSNHELISYHFRDKQRFW